MHKNSLAIIIRSCKPREIRAQFLQKVMSEFFGAPVYILRVDAPVHYSQGFIMELVRFIETCSKDFGNFLIVEDDMLFSKKASSIIYEAIDLDLPNLWCSIPERSLVSVSTKITDNIRCVSLSEPIYYSGAVLLSRAVLKNMLCAYLLGYMNLQQPNFDVFASAFLKTSKNFLFISTDSFATDPSVSSILSASREKQQSGFRHTPLEIDSYFDFENVAPYFTQPARRDLKNAETETYTQGPQT